jgi:hypothetical protein
MLEYLWDFEHRRSSAVRRIRFKLYFAVERQLLAGCRTIDPHSERRLFGYRAHFT